MSMCLYMYVPAEIVDHLLYGFLASRAGNVHHLTPTLWSVRTVRREGVGRGGVRRGGVGRGEEGRGG